MDDETTLRTGVEATLSMRREELGAPPAPEELLAYRDGTLSPAEHALVEEKIAAFPEAAEALLDLACFPDLPAAAGIREVTDDEIAAGWPGLHARIEAAARGAGSAPVGARAAWNRWRTGLAAGLALGAVGGAILAGLVLAPAPGPSAGAALVTLRAGSAGDLTRSTETRIDPAAAQILVLSAADVEPLPAYRLTLRDARERVVWSDAEVAPTPEGLVTVHLPGGTLAPGAYRIDLSPPGGGAPLATYFLRAGGS